MSHRSKTGLEESDCYWNVGSAKNRQVPITSRALKMLLGQSREKSKIMVRGRTKVYRIGKSVSMHLNADRPVSGDTRGDAT